MHSAGSPKLSLAGTDANTHTRSWQGQWLGYLGLLALLGFAWLPHSYTLMVSWPYCLWWQGAFGLLVSWSLWMSRQFQMPLQLLGFHLDKIALFIIFGLVLSTLNAEFKSVAVSNFLLFSHYGIVLYLVVNWIRQSPQLKRRLWLVLVLAGTLTHTISLTLWRPTTTMWSAQNFNMAIRNPLPLGHHNFVGGYCLLMLPLVIGYTLTQTTQSQTTQSQTPNRQSAQYKWLGYGAITLNVIALYASGSRGALIGALCTGALALCFYFTHCFKHHPANRVKHAIACGFLCFLLIATLISNPRIRSLRLLAPAANNAQFSIEQIDDGPTKDRLFMLIAGKNIIKTHPILGVGPGNLSRVYTLYRPLEAGNGLDLVQQLHNTPVQVFAELGVIGFLGYLLWLGAIVKIGISLHKKPLDKTDRILLYSISASWFGYTVSSLTDYQLENIGIASTLLFTTVLLISLADSYLENTTITTLPKKLRRLLSLGLLIYFSIILQVWAKTDTGLYLVASAQADHNTYNLIDADKKFLKAAELLPWDPTYGALAADQFIEIHNHTDNIENKSILKAAAIASLKTALKAAPNDPWFNQNLGTLLIEKNKLKQAELYLRRAAQLSPRNYHQTYFTLGCIYLKQGNNEQAKVAFVLEAISHPQFLVDAIWENPSFAKHLPDVVNQTLIIWKQLLVQTSPNAQQYTWLYQQIALMQWWYQQLLSITHASNNTTHTDIALSTAALNTTIQAILQTEKNPALALELFNQAIENKSLTESTKYLILRAWLAPDQYLESLLESIDGTPTENQTLIDNIHANRDLRSWLTSIQTPIAGKVRHGLAFAYRNSAANNIRQLLFADGLKDNALFNQLALFPNPPREFPQLDRIIAQIKAEALALPTPSQNHFQLSK